jgi:flagellar biogenesis protein FliO
MIEVAAGRGLSGASWDRRGIVGWILALSRRRVHSQTRLAVLERITLAPRQSLTLIEAEGCKLLVATSPDAAPTFYALDAHAPTDPTARRGTC